MHGDKIKLFYLNLTLCWIKSYKFHYLKKQVLHKYTKTCTTIDYFVLICHFLHPCGLNTNLSFSILFNYNFEILLTTVRKDYGRCSTIQLVPDIDLLQQVEGYVRQYQVTTTTSHNLFEKCKKGILPHYCPNIMAVSFVGEGNRRTQRKPSTCY